MKARDWVVAFAALAASASLVPAQEVNVRNRGRLSLDAFDCSTVESSFIRRVCYDEAHQYLLIQLGSSWYDYCDVPYATVQGLLEAESLARYFNANVRGQFDCRANQVPRYR